MTDEGSPADAYAGGGFRGRLGPGARPLVLVVDVLRAYLTPSSPLYAAGEAAALSAARVVAAARAAGVGVVFTEVRYARGGPDSGLWWVKIPALRVLEEGSPLAGLADSPAPVAGEPVLVKQFASAFFGTPLLELVRERDVDTLLVLGFSTSGCVRATVVDALQHGLRALVVREAVGDRDPGPHEAALRDMDAKYGDVVSETEALALLRAPGS